MHPKDRNALIVVAVVIMAIILCRAPFLLFYILWGSMMLAVTTVCIVGAIYLLKKM